MHRFAMLLAMLSLAAAPLGAQVTIGQIPNTDIVGIGGGSSGETVIDLGHPATTAGTLTNATVFWQSSSSNAPCPNDFRMRFYHPTTATSFTMIGDRGPFSSGSSPLVSVTLDPPVTIAKGDLIGIYLTGPSSCGAVAATYAPESEMTIDISGNYTGGAIGQSSFDRGLRPGIRASSSSDVLVGVIPVVGFAQGGFGSVFRTDFQILNQGSLTLHFAKLVFHPAGQSASASDPSLTLSLPPNAINTADILSTMGVTGVGSLDVITTGEYAPDVSAHVYNDAGTAGTNGFIEPMLVPEDAIQSGVLTDLVFPTNLTNYRMNVGIRTLAQGATIGGTLYDAAGNNIGRTSVTYGPNYFIQVSLAQFLAPWTAGGPTPGGHLAIQVGASSSVIMYTSTTDNRTNDSAITILKPRR